MAYDRQKLEYFEKKWYIFEANIVNIWDLIVEYDLKVTINFKINIVSSKETHSPEAEGPPASTAPVLLLAEQVQTSLLYSYYSLSRK